MSEAQALERLRDAVRSAAAGRTTLCLRGGGTKDFYGEPPRGEQLDTREYRGIVAYEPTELVVTARCGTPLAELEAALSEKGQMLAFEPPHFAPGSTVGGMVAAGLSGPRRASAGAVRDFVLGSRVMDGEGRTLTFGGQVMKNVAGYDVSRLLAGSLGTLALILEVSLKTQPRPVCDFTLELELGPQAAIDALNRWAAARMPLSASAWSDGRLHVRLSGATSAAKSAREVLGGHGLDEVEALRFWHGIRDHSAGYFREALPLWRLSVPPTTSSDALASIAGTQLIEWGGGLRWCATHAPAADVREATARVGGHATLFRGAHKNAGVFAPLPPVLMEIHRRLKAALDPRCIFNPGRMYPDL